MEKKREREREIERDRDKDRDIYGYNLYKNNFKSKKK